MDWVQKMTEKKHSLARWLAGVSVKRPWLTLFVVLVVTTLAMIPSSKIELRLNFTDLLPEGNEDVAMYRDIQERYGEPSIVVALEGDRDEIAAMAEVIEPKLRDMEGVYSVQGHMPTEFFLQHGFSLLRPNDFDRSLRIYSDPSLLGVLRGFNDDYEREYTDNEDNMRRDELEISRNLLGLARYLEVLEQNLDDGENAPPIEEAADALLTGEPWMFSLDRDMLLIVIYPIASIYEEVDDVITLVENIQVILDDDGEQFPGVTTAMTGMGPIGQAEMNSVTTGTQVLSLLAFLLIYLLLARSFRGWILPIIALIPLIFGIIWTMGLLGILFGTLNMFTAMIGLVLLGLGIDFTIHLMSRYFEERSHGVELQEAVVLMIGGTGKGVITGGLTTAAAFFALLVADTVGVYEFGVATGSGIICTLLAVFTSLPALLVIRERVLIRLGKELKYTRSSKKGWPILGAITGFCWRHNAIILILFVLIAAGSLWGAYHTSFEYDFLELEPQYARAIQLQRVIPDRFGISEQSAWAIVHDVEESRELKENLRDKPAVGNIASISDYMNSPERMQEYSPRLQQYRDDIARFRNRGWRSGDEEALAAEIDRLWDNLDLMSNLAFMGGIDRVVHVIDNITGYDNETNTSDSTAVLQTMIRRLSDGVDTDRMSSLAERWQSHMQERLICMANDDLITRDELPQMALDAHLPRESSGEDEYLLSVYTRDYSWSKEANDRFVSQVTEEIPRIVSNQSLFIVMTQKTLEDGELGALLALGVIVLLLLFHFRGFTGLLAIVPLLGSALMMLGIMYVTGMKYNYMNLIAIPIILGIGIDDGVHALHRYRELASKGGERVREAFSHVGRAIMLTSLTTMIGFGSIALYKMPGMASFGLVLFMGVGFCFVATILVLPAVMRVFIRK